MSRLVAGLLVAVALLGAVALGPSAPAAIAQAPTTTAPTGPTLNPETEQEAADNKQKVVVAVIAIALLGLVFYGNRLRHKKTKKK